MKLAVLHSGRLIMERAQYDHALDKLATDFALVEVGRRRDESKRLAAGQIDKQLVDE